MKSEVEYSAQDIRMASFAKALGHPARLRILSFLYQEESCFCGDLVKEIGLAQATVSQHLKELKNQGIIKGQITGPAVCYCINPEIWEEMKVLFHAFLDHSLHLKSNCC